MPVWFAVFALISVAAYPAADLAIGFPRLYESLGTVAVFQLLLAMVAPGTRPDREAFFAALPRKRKYNGKTLHDRGSLGWYRRRCAYVYQFPLVNVVLFLLTELGSAKFCATSKQGRVIKAIVGIVLAVSASFIVVAIVQFVARFYDVLKPKRGGVKILVFKSVETRLCCPLIERFSNEAEILNPRNLELRLLSTHCQSFPFFMFVSKSS